jgi:hypothetical protein
MPVNFEIDFVQPLLKDLRNGEYADVQAYVEGITKYYMRALSKGMPLGISPTLPSPAALGAPAPVGTGPLDVFGKPFNEGSRVRFKNTIDQFYTAREIVLSKENIEAKRQALEGIIRKAEYQTKLLQTTIRRVGELKTQVSLIPQEIKNTIEGIKKMFEVFVQQLKNVREDILDFSFEELQELGDDFNIEEEFKTRFPAEAAIVDSLLNLDFTKPRQVVTTIQKASEYFGKIKADTQSSVRVFQQFDQEQQRDYVRRRLEQVVAKMVRISSGLLFPESLGELIIDLKQKGEKFDEQTERVLRKAIVASDRLGFIKFYVQPEIKKLEELVRTKEKRIKEQLQRSTENIKESLDKKVRELVQKQSKIKLFGSGDKKKSFKAKKEKAEDLKDKIKSTVATTTKNVKTATALIQKSTALINAGLVIKDEVLKTVTDFQSKIEAIKTNTEQNTEDLQQIRFTPNPDLASKQKLITYLRDHGSSAITETPLIKAITDANINFIDVKKLFEETSTTYDQLYNKVLGLKEDLIDLKDLLLELKGTFISKTKDKSEDKATRRDRREQPKQTILSVLKELQDLLNDADGFRKKIQDDINSFIKKQQTNLDKYKRDLEIKLIAALPVPTETEDFATKAQAAKEKAEVIKQYKVKIEQTTKKAKAVSLLAINAAKLGTNLSQGKISAATNDPIMRKVANAILEFNTVGVNPQSSKYKQEEDRNRILLKEIDTLREIDTYVSIITTIAQDASNYKDIVTQAKEQGQEQAASFGSAIKEEYERIIQSAIQSQTLFSEGGVRGVSPIINKLLESLETIFSGQAKPDQIIAEARKLITISKSDFLTETLQSQPLVMALQSFEREYLVKTKTTLTKILGVLPPQEEQQLIQQATSTPQGENPPATGPIATSAQATKDAIERSRQAAAEKINNNKLYKSLVDMYEAINEGKGSVISIIVAKVVELLKQFEAFIKKQINNQLTVLKKRIKDEIQKNKEQYEKRLQQILRRKDFVDLAATSITYNIATQLFWTGASWQNNVGTTFQVLFIQPMKPLKVNGRIDGYGAAVRELARNLENQLNGVQGLCIPNPATGIPPFPFKGYK